LPAFGSAGLAGYCAAKGGVRLFAKAVATELVLRKVDPEARRLRREALSLTIPEGGQCHGALADWRRQTAIPPEITNITGITDEMVAGHRINDRAVNDLLDRVILVIAHNADFDRRFLEKRLPAFTTKHRACSRADIDWKAEGIRSSALEFVAYSLGFFHDGHRAASDCRATLHALAQPLPGTGRLAMQALLEQARLPTWRLWARDAAIEKKDVLKARGYAWSPGAQLAHTSPIPRSERPPRPPGPPQEYHRS
jgi:DNA polymerase III epsilon subunit-like protein